MLRVKEEEGQGSCQGARVERLQMVSAFYTEQMDEEA